MENCHCTDAIEWRSLANEPEVWLFYAWEILKNLVNLLLRWNRGTVDGCYLYLDEI